MKLGIDYIGISTTFICTDGNGRILMHKRSINCRDERGCWDAGGGKLEFGIDLEENVRREIAEEYGCECEILHQLPPVTILRQQDGQATHWLAICFITKINPSEAKNNEPQKLDELGWFTLDQLPQPLHSGMAMVLERHRKTITKYLR